MNVKAISSTSWPYLAAPSAKPKAAATLGMCVVGALIALGYAETTAGAVLAIATLVTFSGMSPAGALGTTILALPTAFKLYSFPAGSFSLVEVSILALTAGLGIRLICEGRESILRAWRSLVQPVSITLPAFAILPAAAVAYLMLGDRAFPDEALREIRVTLFEPLLLFAAALIIMRDRRARSWAWTCAVVIGAVIGVGACVQVVGGFGGVDTGPITRATGIYSHPNNLALFLERTFLLTLPMIAFRRRDPILWIAIVAQTAGIFLTFSRGAILAVIVGVGISLLILGMRRNLMVFSGLALGIGAVLFITSRERLLDLGGSGSEPTRFAIWRSSLEMLADHAVFGIGPDQFLYQYVPRYIEPSAWDERYTSHPHNIVLDVWLRLGAAGIGAFAALIIGVWKLGRRSSNRIRNDAISCGAIAALAGAMAHGLLDNGFFLPDLAGMTWIAIAMLVTFGPASSPVVASEVEPNGD